MRMGTRASRCTPSGVGREWGTAKRPAVSGSVRDTGVSVGMGERVEDAVGADVAGKDAGERVNEE